MSDWLAQIIDTVRGDDHDRPRSQQAEVGWSEVGACRAYVGFRLSGEWASDDTDPWRAIVGTALHAWLQARPGAEGSEFEVETRYAGILGHADEVDADSVTDYKFPTRAVSESWRSDPDALAQKMGQVQGYAAGLVTAGRLPADCTVRLLVAPVDGTFADWWVHEEPYDEATADAGAARYREVQGLLDQGLTPPRDMPYSWCERFCEFFSVCRNSLPPSDDEPITDPELVAMVRQYGELGEDISPKAKLRKQIAAQIKGLRGVADGWRVGLTRPSGFKDAIDMEQVEADYAASGRPVPTKQVPTSAPSLRVDRIKEGK